MNKLLQLVCLTLSLGLATSAFSQLSKEKLIIGKWQLISKSGGFTGKMFYADSIMKRKKIEFTQDSIYREFYKDSLIFESKYHFGKTNSKYATNLIIIKDHPQRGFLSKLLFSQRQLFSLRNGSLSLIGEEWADGLSSNYRRVSPIPIKRKQLKKSKKIKSTNKN